MSPPEESLSAIGVEPDEVIADFRWTQATTKQYFLGFTGMMALWVAGVVGGAWLGLTGVDSDTRLAGLVMVCLFLFMAFLSASSWVKHYRNTATRVFLYEAGVIWYSPATKWGAGRWTDAMSFYRKETILGGELASRCRVVFRDREVVFAEQLEHYQSLAGHIQSLMHRALFPVMKARYDAGKEVQFGRIVLTPTEFVAKPAGGRLEWRRNLTEIREAEIAQGSLWLNHITNRTKGFTIQLADIPNYTILIALLPIVPTGWTSSE